MRQVLKVAVLALASLLAAPPVSADATCSESNSNHCGSSCCMEMGNAPSHHMSAGCETQKATALAEASCIPRSCSVTSSEPSQLSAAQTKFKSGND